jgi:uncharacterized protein YggE
MAQIKTDLKVEAIKDAQKKARAMAGAVGQSCGRAIYIPEYQMPRTQLQRSPMMLSSAFRAKANEEEPMPILDFEAIHLEAQLMVRFTLE